MTDDPQMIPAWRDGKLQPVDKLLVHQLGLRHPAISVFVLDDQGRILLQQRAMCKYHTPGLWANTCCTHPHWGEDPTDTAPRRLQQELGITGLTLTHRGQLEYNADVGNNLHEHEVVEVFTAQAPADMRITPNPAEVQATKWLHTNDLTRALHATPDDFTPWLHIYMEHHADMVLG